MNPAKAYAHLFSPLGGDAGDNYRAPGVLTFLQGAARRPERGGPEGQRRQVRVCRRAFR